MSKYNRIVITGVGPVTPIGIGKDAFFHGIASGMSALKDVKDYFESPELKWKKVGMFGKDVNFKKFIGEKVKLRSMNRFGQALWAAVKLAMEDSGMDFMRENYADPSEIGLIVGNTHSTYEESISCAEELGNNPDLVNPMVFANTLPNLVVSAVAQRENIQGPCVTIANQRTASLDSIGIAMQFLTDDRLKVALVGGVDMISMAKLIAFDSSELRNKKNYYLGEGAGIIMMETLEHAQERKAPHVYAEIEKYENYSNTVHSHGTNYKIGRQLGDCLSAGGILELLRLIRLNQENRVSIDYVTLRGFDFLGNRARVKLKFI